MKLVHAFAIVPVIAALGGFALAVQHGSGPGARTKAIRNAMKVMNETPFGGMNDAEGDGTAQRQVLEKRLEMTQIALQLATDRLPVAPPK